MGININAKTDYSYLFSSMNNKNSQVSGMASLLSDYSSIKSGSYGKLMKAYFAETGNSAVDKLAKNSNSNVVTREDAKKLNKVQTATDSLKESADALLVTGSKSVFEKKDITTKDENGVETTAKDYDKDAIYSAVSSFVNSYNSVISAVDNAENSTVTNRGVVMANNTAAYEKSLNGIGITVKDDGTLSLDKDTFMSADMSKVKGLFQGNGSYGYQTSAQVSMINYSASNEASKAATYTGSGSYNSILNTGNLYNSFF